RPRSGRRGQPVACIAHVLGGCAAQLGLRAIVGYVPLVVDSTHDFQDARASAREQNSRKILKTTLKTTLRTRVNRSFFARARARLWIGLFFQAEDGIRYWSVTGVQTCALPI